MHARGALAGPGIRDVAFPVTRGVIILSELIGPSLPSTGHPWAMCQEPGVAVKHTPGWNRREARGC